MTDRPRRRWVWQIGLRTLFLLVTAVAVWTVFFSNRSAIRHYQERIAAMRPLARELTVEDESLIAVIKREPYWYDENRWDVYLPPGRYRLCLATRQIDDGDFPPVVQSAPLSPGRHTLALEQEDAVGGWRVAVECDGRQVLAQDEPQGWYPGSGSVGGGQFDSLTQREPGEPLVLFRRRFDQPAAGGRSMTPTGPTDGVMLWIEREGDLRDDSSQ